MDPKELKKLATACRKAGIKHYKSGDVEFTLSDEPIKAAKPKKAAAPVAGEAEADKTGWDSLTDEQKLMWSVNLENPN